MARSTWSNSRQRTWISLRWHKASKPAESGAMEGAPALGTRDRYAAWARVMEREFAQLRRTSARGMPTVLDPYGAQNPAEFFAVAVECFFERAALLREHHPELYAELADYFRQEPAAW